MADLKDRRKREEELALAIALVLRRYTDLEGLEFKADALQLDLQKAIGGHFERAFFDFGTGVSGEIQFSTAALGPAAETWSKAYGGILAQSVANQVAALAASSESAAREALKNLGDPDRWAALAATDVTRAATAGGELVAAVAAMQVGRSPEALWHTAGDSKVCPFCAPLDQQPRAVWSAIAPQGPPAHPNCRCFIDYFGS